MPFTLSHPAVVVPLARRGLPLSALVIGSMTPDFQYFLHLSSDDRYTHTLPGVFGCCLPVGLVTLWMFHAILKLPLLSLLPVSHQQRLWPCAQRFRFGPLGRFCLIVLALLSGAISHLMWDSFTHATGWAVRHWPLLSAQVFHVPHSSVRVYAILQYASSIGGGLALIYGYWQWWRVAPAEALPAHAQLAPRFKWWLLTGMALCALVLGLVWGWRDTPAVEGLLLLRRFVRYSVIAGISVVCVQLVLFSLYWHCVHQKRSGHWF